MSGHDGAPPHTPNRTEPRSARFEVLVVAGEPSGDRIAALVVRALAAHGIGAFGIAGPAARAAGVEIVADATSLAAMGLADVAARLPDLAGSVARLFARVRRDPPRAALLVNFTELNQRLGRLLRARGTRVLWCVAPQVWAWRPGRIAALHDAVDRLAVILPFEEALWQRAGYDARYVGHPSLDLPARDRAALRADLAIDAHARAVAVLPGSRAGEVLRLARPLAEAAALLAKEGAAARMILAPGLDPRARAAAIAAARAADLTVIEGDPDHGAAPLLGAFDVALCASGTASLEAALAAAAPVVAYRLDPLAFALARRLVRTPHIALPNVLLERRAFPELLQDEVTPSRIAAAARVLLADRAAERTAAELHRVLAPPSAAPFGARVADLLLPWLR
jgi:lipid-A-disaccharide synthase